MGSTSSWSKKPKHKDIGSRRVETKKNGTRILDRDNYRKWKKDRGPLSKAEEGLDLINEKI